MSVFHQICGAVSHLHHQRPPIAHRDLKLENVLHAGAGSFKLCDFGSCMECPMLLGANNRAAVEEDIEKNTTQMYRAPEMVDLYSASALDEKVDVWALGCILYTLAMVTHPFQDAGNLGILGAQYKAADPSICGPGIVEVIGRLLVVDPTARLTIDELEGCLIALYHCKPLPAPPARGQTSAASGAGGGKWQPHSLGAVRRAHKPIKAQTLGSIDGNSAAARRMAARVRRARLRATCARC